MMLQKQHASMQVATKPKKKFKFHINYIFNRRTLIV